MADTWRPLSGDWVYGPNWDSGVAPTSGDDVVFGGGGAYMVTVTTADVADNVTFNAPGATLVESGGSLSLAGGLTIYNGTVALNAPNSIGTSVALAGGILSLSNGNALGSAVLLIDGGELLATATETIANGFSAGNALTIAALAGQTLTLSGTTLLTGPVTLTFGAPGASGAVLWQSTLIHQGSTDDNIDVRSGYLMYASSDSGSLTSTLDSVVVEAGATLELDSFAEHFTQLSGAGTLTNPGGFGTALTIDSGIFQGNVTGQVGLIINGAVDFAGYCAPSSIRVGTSATLTIDVGGTLDLTTAVSMTPTTGASADYIANKGTLLRDGLSGSSTISVPFFNFGDMNISAGSVTFTGGFGNFGIVQGNLRTNADGSVTWSTDSPLFGPSYQGGPNNDVFDLTTAPSIVDGGGGTNTIDVLASMTFGAGSVVNVQRFAVANGVNANLSNLNLGPETIFLDSLSGGGATVTGTRGNDTIIGGSGVDTCVYTVTRASATITRGSNGAVTISDANDGTDTLGHIEWAQFTDQRVWIGPAQNDFNGDGTSDILWRNQATGDVYEWTMANGQRAGSAYLGNLNGWSEIGTGDFFGGGTSDLLWQNQSTGGVYEWQMSGGQHNGNDVYLGDLAGWSEAGVGDFFGDGTSDLLWQNQSTGDVYEWQMSSGQHIGSDLYLGNFMGWSEAGSGDFYGNGTSDLLWQSQTTGDVYEWQMSNGQHVGNDVYLGRLAGWSEVGVGDFYGNGTDDLLWQNQSTGDVYEWTMSGGQHSGNDIYLGNLSGWSVIGTGDYSGSGTAGIIWQNQASGAIWEWTMANGQHTSSAFLGNLPGWQGK
jgi:hypothetical protein